MRSAANAMAGFGLVETLIASTTILLALSALAQLVTASAVAARRSRGLTLAAAFAQDKVERLAPDAIAGALAASPSDALVRNVDGFCDFLDARGAPLGGGSAAPADAVFIRRWSITNVPTAGSLAVAISVRVVDVRGSGADAQIAALMRTAP